MFKRPISDIFKISQIELPGPPCTASPAGLSMTSSSGSRCSTRARSASAAARARSLDRPPAAASRLDSHCGCHQEQGDAIGGPCMDAHQDNNCRASFAGAHASIPFADQLAMALRGTLSLCCIAQAPSYPRCASNARLCRVLWCPRCQRRCARRRPGAAAGVRRPAGAHPWQPLLVPPSASRSRTCDASDHTELLLSVLRRKRDSTRGNVGHA